VIKGGATNMPKEIQLWTPLHEMERMRRDFDDLFNRFFGAPKPFAFLPESLAKPAIECFRKNDTLIVRADLPGIDPKDVEVTVSGSTLMLSGKRQEKHEEKAADYLHREVSYGNFERTMSLPPGVKPEDIKASYEHGVLELTIPLPKDASAHKVPITIGKEGASERSKS
jgi:HSP20 family protein